MIKKYTHKIKKSRMGVGWWRISSEFAEIFKKGPTFFEFGPKFTFGNRMKISLWSKLESERLFCFLI